MKETIQVEVLVIGAGPVGLFSALVLAKRGVKVAIIDSQPQRSTHSYALALHSQSLGLFDAYGLLDDLLTDARKISRVELYHNHDRAARLDLRSNGFDTPFLAMAVAGQDQVERTLEAALAKEGVRVQWSHRAAEILHDKHQVRIRVDELRENVIGYAVPHADGFVGRSREYEAAFVIGADGHNSFVRRHLDIPFPEVAPPEDFAVFQFDSGVSEPHTVQIVDFNGLVNVRWPVGDTSCRWSFQLKDEGVPPQFLRRKNVTLFQKIGHTATAPLDDARLGELLSERIPWHPVQIRNVYWNLWVRFERRLAERFGEGRVWLAGDAGHLTGPVGVQSMNVGLTEGHDLARRIADYLSGDATSTVFTEYNRERLAEWSFLLGQTGGLEPTARASTALAAHRARLLSWLPASGPDLGLVADALGFEINGWEAGTARLDTQ